MVEYSDGRLFHHIFLFFRHLSEYSTLMMACRNIPPLSGIFRQLYRPKVFYSDALQIVPMKGSTCKQLFPSNKSCCFECLKVTKRAAIMSEESQAQVSDMEDQEEGQDDVQDVSQEQSAPSARKIGRRTSIIWEYFTDCEDPKKVKCTICDAKVILN